VNAIEYNANAKLLLFGEYFVLDSCPALAVPLLFGQQLHHRSDFVQVKGLHWKSYDHKEQLWFEAFFDENLNLLHHLNAETAQTLQHILRQASILNPNWLKDGKYHEALTKIDYPIEWGLGSSSTLVALIAQWSKTNPFDLFFSCLTGSGYDIACALSQNPICYTLRGHNPEVANVTINWSFKKQLVFIYTGKKQSSSEAISHYKKMDSNKLHYVNQMENIVYEAIRCSSKNEMLSLMQRSEDLISESLQLEKVKDRLFPDFPGSIKSLGAWGGDFVMALSNTEDFNTKKYFAQKGYIHNFSYQDIVLETI
jgi:mevalonate kinase